MEKKYIMIGASSINRDAFRRVLRPLDNYSFKPTGGFWACEKGDDLINISPWLDYLIEEREIALMKNIKAASIDYSAAFNYIFPLHIQKKYSNEKILCLYYTYFFMY